MLRCQSRANYRASPFSNKTEKLKKLIPFYGFNIKKIIGIWLREIQLQINCLCFELYWLSPTRSSLLLVIILLPNQNLFSVQKTIPICTNRHLNENIRLLDTFKPLSQLDGYEISEEKKNKTEKRSIYWIENRLARNNAFSRKIFECIAFLRFTICKSCFRF